MGLGGQWASRANNNIRIVGGGGFQVRMIPKSEEWWFVFPVLSWEASSVAACPPVAPPTLFRHLPSTQPASRPWPWQRSASRSSPQPPLRLPMDCAPRPAGLSVLLAPAFCSPNFPFWWILVDLFVIPARHTENIAIMYPLVTIFQLQQVHDALYIRGWCGY